MKTASFLIRRPFILALLLTFTVLGTRAQQATPSPALTREEQLAKEKEMLDKETELLDARQKYLDALKRAAGNSSITADTSGGKTDYSAATTGIFETTSLSFEAAKELADDVDKRMSTPLANYDAIIFFSDADFNALSRYRLYRTQAGIMLADYDALLREINGLKPEPGGDENVFSTQSVDKSFAGGALLTTLNLPGIATSAIKSVAELLSLFRTDRTVTEYPGGVDDRALNTVLAGTLLKKHGSLRIYDPVQYVPEYDGGLEERDSFYSELARVRAANVIVTAFLEAMSKVPLKQRQSPPLAPVIGHAVLVKAQLDGLLFPVLPDPVPNDPAAAASLTEFRWMVRAEKLDRFIRRYPSNRIGVIRSRVISSGGSVRQSKNLLLGTKTDYSGSSIVEVLLYDLDGGMRASEIFTYHTGFRKLKNGVSVKPQ
ncbi:MAG: hypothetical protein JO053_01255 [Acidobacteria bacterium]|nr:hypothetical protein [Acidobacteriota bacterium]